MAVLCNRPATDIGNEYNEKDKELILIISVLKDEDSNEKQHLPNS